MPKPAVDLPLPLPVITNNKALSVLAAAASPELRRARAPGLRGAAARVQGVEEGVGELSQTLAIAFKQRQKPQVAKTKYDYLIADAVLSAGAFDHAIRDYSESLRRNPASAAAKRNLEIALRRRQQQQQGQCPEGDAVRGTHAASDDADISAAAMAVILGRSRRRDDRDEPSRRGFGGGDGLDAFRDDVVRGHDAGGS